MLSRDLTNPTREVQKQESTRIQQGLQTFAFAPTDIIERLGARPKQKQKPEVMKLGPGVEQKLRLRQPDDDVMLEKPRRTVSPGARQLSKTSKRTQEKSLCSWLARASMLQKDSSTPRQHERQPTINPDPDPNPEELDPDINVLVTTESQKDVTVTERDGHESLRASEGQDTIVKDTERATEPEMERTETVGQGDESQEGIQSCSIAQKVQVVRTSASGPRPR